MGTRWLATMLVMCACGPQLICGEGASERDGQCVSEQITPADPDFTAILASMQPCEATEPGTELDLEALCVGDVCVGDSIEDVRSELLDACRREFGLAECPANAGSLFFADADEDGQPDEDATVLLIDVTDGTVRGPSGVGLGALLSCFVDQLSTPDLITASRLQDGTWVLREVTWADRVRVADDMAFGFSIEDRFEPEGRSDVLELGSRFGG